jgi:tripartite ATP-independent transporter DctM subunit
MDPGGATVPAAAQEVLAAHVPLGGRLPSAWPHRIENGVVAACLAAMILLPVLEIVLRRLFSAGIPGVQSIVQHLVLAVGMLGPALAARDRRLLTISTLPALLPPRPRAAARGVSSVVAAVVAAFLCVAALQFVGAEREAVSDTLAGVPLWTIQALLPLGFGLILARLVVHAADGVAGRLAAAAATGVLVAWLAWATPSAAAMAVPLLLAVVAATILGGPVFALLGGVALVLFWREDLPIASLPLDHYRLVVNPSLAAVPLFTAAGYLLAESRAPDRLIRVFRALFGGFVAGPALVTVVVCAFFTAFTGASGVTILALGGLLLPLLLGARYRERDALGLITSAGSLGVLLPPSLPLILYAVVAKVPLDRMFLAALLPGLLMAGLLLAWGIRARGRASAGVAFDARELRAALWNAKWELATPVVAVGMLFGGFATPVEAAAVTALYAAIITAGVHRDLRPLRDLPRVLAECGLLVGGILLILGVALGLTNWLVDAQVPDRVTEWVQSSIQSRWLFLLVLNVCLLLVGCLMDVFSATIVVVPLLVPIGAAFGIDPLHLGVMFLANMELGFLTPLVGMNVIFAAYRFGRPMPEMMRAVAPPFAVMLAGVLLITYLPALTNWLPGLIAG